MSSGRVARIAVGGAGWWGQGWHLPHLARNPNAKIAAIIEPAQHPRSSNAAQTLLPTAELTKLYDAPVFSSLDEMLTSECSVDGLLVGTPHASHFALGMAAMDAGLNVLMEKPMTTDVEEARRLVARADEHAAVNRVFMINHTANWRPATQQAAGAVAAGRIGRVTHVAATMHSPLMWLFDDPANAGWVQPTGRMSGNGFGWGQLSHLFAWIFGVTALEPCAVFAVLSPSSRSGADLHDAVTVRCEGGASITVSGSAGVPGDAHGDAPVGKRIAFQIFGTEGMLSYGGDDQQPDSGALELRRHDGSHERLHPTFLFENYEPLGDGPESLHAFVDACAGRDCYVGADARCGLQTVRTLDAMYRSQSSGAVEPCG